MWRFPVNFLFSQFWWFCLLIYLAYVQLFGSIITDWCRKNNPNPNVCCFLGWFNEHFRKPWFLPVNKHVQVVSGNPYRWVSYGFCTASMQPVKGLGPSGDKSNPFCIKSLGNASVSLKNKQSQVKCRISSCEQEIWKLYLALIALPWSGLEIPLKNLEIPQALWP